MMKMRGAVLAALALLLSAGCAHREIERNLDNAAKLRAGMTKEQVLAIMGEPLTGEAFNTPDCWYYYVRTVWHDGLSTQDECMPLFFRDGRLIGWGDEYAARRKLQAFEPERPVSGGMAKPKTAAEENAAR